MPCESLLILPYGICFIGCECSQKGEKNPQYYSQIMLSVFQCILVSNSCFANIISSLWASIAILNSDEMIAQNSNSSLGSAFSLKTKGLSRGQTLLWVIFKSYSDINSCCFTLSSFWKTAEERGVWRSVFVVMPSCADNKTPRVSPAPAAPAGGTAWHQHPQSCSKAQSPGEERCISDSKLMHNTNMRAIGTINKEYR